MCKINLVLCICNSNPMVLNSQHFQQMSIEFSPFLARPFANYFVLDMSHGYGIHQGKEFHPI